MKKKIISCLLCFMFVFPFAFIFGGCGCSSNKAKTLSTRELYAMFAVSSATYLSNLGVTSEFSFNNSTISNYDFASRPEIILDGDVEQLASYIQMFEGMILGGVGETLSLTTEEDVGYYEIYKLKMVINIPKVGGETETFIMFFNEIANGQEESVGLEEVEISSTIEGVLINSGNSFIIAGSKTVEVEQNETETTLEFTTKSSINENNYITISQEVETENSETEIEYCYTSYINGRKVDETKVEFENENDEIKLEVEFISRSNGTVSQNKYEISKASDNRFLIIIKNSSGKERFYASKTATGYKFAYANGATEEF